MVSKRDHGDGGIDERSPGQYRLRWRVDGKRYSKSFHGPISDARRELRRLIKSADDGQHVAPDKLTLAAWVDRWVALLRRGNIDKPRRGLVNARTLERYEDLMRVHVLPTLGKRPLQRITPSEIDALYTKMEQDLAPATVRFAHAVLGACLAVAVRKGLLLSNPVSRAEPPAPGDQNAGQVLDQEQLAALLAGFRGTTLYPIVATAAFTGARRNEILALQWSDVNLGDKTLTIARTLEMTKAYGRRFKEPKTRRGSRTIAIDDALANLLIAEREKHLRIAAGVTDGGSVDLSLIKLPEGALVFPSAMGAEFDFTRPRHPQAITGEFIKRASKLGFPKLRFHDLRCTHETLLLDAGVPVHVVAARCGHDPAVLLRVYAKRTKKADTSAAATLGLLSKSVLGARD
jgi:integrase